MNDGEQGLEKGISELCKKAEEAVQGGATILILSDRGADKEHTPIPALLATGAVHHHLIREGLRTKCGLVIETGEARECHHFATLIGFGAGAVNPYIALATLEQMGEEGYFEGIDTHTLHKNYIKAIGIGLPENHVQMGVSTLLSYRGAQIFEAIGLNTDVVSKYFTGTATRIEGAGIKQLAEEIAKRMKRAYPDLDIPEALDLDVGGLYQWRRRGEYHSLNPHYHRQAATSGQNQQHRGLQRVFPLD